jgi:hypothetical protein
MSNFFEKCPIIGYDVSIVQSPNANNHFHAVCRAAIKTPYGVYTSIGEAQGKDESEIKGLLQQAEEDGFKRTAQIAEIYCVQMNQPISYQDIDPQNPTTPTNGRNSVGSGDNPITDKQINAIRWLSSERGVNIDLYVNQTYGTKLNMLGHSQAQEIFDYLNSLPKIK